MRFLPPQRLSSDVDFSRFKCGNEQLDTWLKKYAIQANQSGGGITYLLFTEELKIAGFYSIANCSVIASDVTPRIRQGMGKHPIPAILLTRLAVDLAFQGQGLGKALLEDCIMRSINLSELIGIRALVAHPIDEAAFNFYFNMGFDESPKGSNQQMILLKDAGRRISDSLG